MWFGISRLVFSFRIVGKRCVTLTVDDLLTRRARRFGWRPRRIGGIRNEWWQNWLTLVANKPSLVYRLTPPIGEHDIRPSYLSTDAIHVYAVIAIVSVRVAPGQTHRIIVVYGVPSNIRIA